MVFSAKMEYPQLCRNNDSQCPVLRLYSFIAHVENKLLPPSFRTGVGWQGEHFSSAKITAMFITVRIPFSKSNTLLRRIIFRKCLELTWITLSLSGLGVMTLGHAIVIALQLMH